MYARPADGSGGEWQISVKGGRRPYWSRDGKEILYRQDAMLMAVPVGESGDALKVGSPAALFPVPTAVWDVHPDGKRFLIAELAESHDPPAAIHIIENWPALLKRKIVP